LREIVIEPAELSNENGNGPGIADDVMETKNEKVMRVGEAEESSPEKRAERKIERRASLQTSDVESESLGEQQIVGGDIFGREREFE